MNRVTRRSCNPTHCCRLSPRARLCCAVPWFCTGTLHFVNKLAEYNKQPEALIACQQLINNRSCRETSKIFTRSKIFLADADFTFIPAHINEHNTNHECFIRQNYLHLFQRIQPQDTTQAESHRRLLSLCCVDWRCPSSLLCYGWYFPLQLVLVWLHLDCGLICIGW